jgi:hypothetical protein
MATLVFKVGTGAASYSNSYSVDLESSSDQYLEANGSSAFDLSTYGESFSISMWVKAESYATGDFNAFVSKGGAYRVSRQNSQIYFNVAPDSGGFGGDSAYIAHGGTGTWQHFVFVFDGEKLSDASYVASGQVPTKIYRVTELYNSGSPADLSSHSAASDLVSWYRMGDNASDDLTADTGQVTDVEGSNNLIPRNTTSSSKVEDTPGS